MVGTASHSLRLSPPYGEDDFRRIDKTVDFHLLTQLNVIQRQS